LRSVGKDDVLGLSAMVQHHLVGFSSKTRFLVTSKGSMGRIKVVAVHPNTTSFNVASQFHSTVDISGPNTSTMILTGLYHKEFVFDEFEQQHDTNWGLFSRL